MESKSWPLWFRVCSCSCIAVIVGKHYVMRSTRPFCGTAGLEKILGVGVSDTDTAQINRINRQSASHIDFWPISYGERSWHSLGTHFSIKDGRLVTRWERRRTPGLAYWSDFKRVLLTAVTTTSMPHMQNSFRAWWFRLPRTEHLDVHFIHRKGKRECHMINMIPRKNKTPDTPLKSNIPTQKKSCKNLSFRLQQGTAKHRPSKDE